MYQSFIFLVLLSLNGLFVFCDDYEALKVARKNEFTFTEKPQLKKNGNQFELSFSVKSYCDVTVVIENKSGKICRHLVSGVLGAKAPAPFLKNSLKQVIVWDGKDDTDKYVENVDDYKMRVSLGLKAQFERDLYASPFKKESEAPQIIVSAKEGVYVYDGGDSLDHIRLFSRDGDYLKTVYPFSSDKIKNIKGVAWKKQAHDGKDLPIKTNFLQNNFLTSGDNGISVWDDVKKKYKNLSPAEGHYGMYVRGAGSMAIYNEQIALVGKKINWFKVDGSSSETHLTGPDVTIGVHLRTIHEFNGGKYTYGPRSVVYSPDGKWLYMGAYIWTERWHVNGVSAIARIPVGAGPDVKPDFFIGSTAVNKGKIDPNDISYNYSIDVDSSGRLYACDYLNQLVRIYSPDGKMLKSIKTPFPSKVMIHKKTNEIYVASWAMRNDHTFGKNGLLKVPLGATLTKFGSFDNLVKQYSIPIPFSKYTGKLHFTSRGLLGGFQYDISLDAWSDKERFWITPDLGWKQNIKVMEVNSGKWTLVKDFGEVVDKKFGDLARPLDYKRWRLYSNPNTGKAYLTISHFPNAGMAKAFYAFAELDPNTGLIKNIDMPLSSEEAYFDQKGFLYLRGDTHVGRYEFGTMKEVPWDYGEEIPKLAFGSSGSVYGNMVSALPVFHGINWHMGGMGVNPKGHIAVGSYGHLNKNANGDDYGIKIYEGRLVSKKGCLVHVWDRYGKLIAEDAIGGLPDVYGIEIDNDGYLYIMTSGTKYFNGEKYYNDLTGTLIKVKPGKSMIKTKSDTIPLPLKEMPNRAPDFSSALQGGAAWIEGAEWLYGGAGFNGKNRGLGCACWNSRFVLDNLKRSFVPELDRYSVAVLDTEGNVITRIGTYGNLDDGKPLVDSDYRNAKSEIRSIGGDEVALMHGAYLATDTDKRLFIADMGNSRVLSVKLNYHQTEILSLSVK